MTKITSSDIDHVAKLSRLAFTPEQTERFADQLSAILGYAAKLDELDTSNVAPTSHSFPMTNVFRDDKPQPSLTREAALANAPESEADCFKVPQIIQG